MCHWFYPLKLQQQYEHRASVRSSDQNLAYEREPGAGILLSMNLFTLFVILLGLPSSCLAYRPL
jgi:hypothetical protein